MSLSIRHFLILLLVSSTVVIVGRSYDTLGSATETCPPTDQARPQTTPLYDTLGNAAANCPPTDQARPQTAIYDTLCRAAAKCYLTDEAMAQATQTPSLSMALVYSWGLSVATVLCSIYMSFHLRQFGPPDAFYYALCIVYTPGIHAIDQHLRMLYYSNSSRFVFTYLEAFREIYTSLATLCFMQILYIQLKVHFGVDSLDKQLQNKLFSFHYPFDIVKPTVWRTSKNNLFWMRVFCYQSVVSTAVLYSARIVLEHVGLFEEPLGHLLQTVYFVTSSLGILSVYAFAQGVDMDIPQHKMARKIGLFKLLAFLLWFEGPGVELMMSAQSYLIFASLLWFAITQIMDLNPPQGE